MSNVSVKEHEQNSHVWVRAIFRDADYEYANPSSITLVITEPDGTETTKTKADMEQWTERDSSVQTGHWRYKFLADQLGYHKCEWTWEMAASPGTHEGNETHYFEVV